ncbi:DUF4260 domain-containing protein [Paraglaciecola sp. 2405UD69-4]|uniref:DUF4260 domain-containing protein n=1 Tax=Paraglaciecola sp. 2405UD69-4 TaxID=3391836 RepID=UPI0039C9CD2F
MKAVTGNLQWVLRLEGLGVFAASLIVFSGIDGNWLLFFAAFLIPDITLLAYLVNKNMGALFYNLSHSIIGPMLLVSFALLYDVPIGLTISCIWLAHIGFDRALGYGLKYQSDFNHTHLGIIGRNKS